jgi:zona occludens toxin (predicted ATPase)
MTLFLVLVLVALMISVVVVLIRGLVSFLGNARAEIDGTGPSEGAIKSNKLMWSRIYLQGAAIGVIALIALVASAKG